MTGAIPEASQTLVRIAAPGNELNIAAGHVREGAKPVVFQLVRHLLGGDGLTSS